MEKLYSGMSFLYRDGGYNSTVLDVHMKKKVRGDFLTRALNLALPRYPYLSSKLVEKNGDFYLEKDLNSMVAIKSRNLRKLGSMATGYHILDVTWYDEHILVSWHHAVCDGRGIKPFVESLLYYYSSLRDNRHYDSTGIRLAEEPLLPGESIDPFAVDQFPVVTERTPAPELVRDGYALPENVGVYQKDYRYEFDFEKDGFMERAKSVGATPSIYISLLISKAIAGLYPDFDRPIVCSLAFDTRKALGLENTHKNCVSSIFLPYTHALKLLPMREQSEQYREVMNEQKDDDYVRTVTNRQIRMLDQMSQATTLADRLNAFSPFSTMCTNTFVLSYLGRFHLNDFEDHISSIHLYSSGVRGLRFNMISAGEQFSLDVIQTFESEEIVHRIEAVFQEQGLSFTNSGRIEFSTPKDITQKTGKWHAERYRV